MQARFRLTRGYETGPVVKRNTRTIWVRVGARIIKRHRVKHDCTVWIA